MTSKQRAYLKGLAMSLDPVFQIGKASLTPEVTEAVWDHPYSFSALQASPVPWYGRFPVQLAEMLAERTGAQVVQVIGKKIVLYKENKDHKKIELPR